MYERPAPTGRPLLRPAHRDHSSFSARLFVMPGFDRASLPFLPALPLLPVCVAWEPLHIRYGNPHNPPHKNSVKGLPDYELSDRPYRTAGHRMRFRRSTAILWPRNRRNSPFPGHRMKVRGKIHILWPACRGVLWRVSGRSGRLGALSDERLTSGPDNSRLSAGILHAKASAELGFGDCFSAEERIFLPI